VEVRARLSQLYPLALGANNCELGAPSRKAPPKAKYGGGRNENRAVPKRAERHAPEWPTNGRILLKGRTLTTAHQMQQRREENRTEVISFARAFHGAACKSETEKGERA